MLLTEAEQLIYSTAEPVAERYCLTTDGFDREVVLLKSRFCKWRKCTFCDYWADGSQDINELDEVNFVELDKITGETGVLEIINSGSIFELPKAHIERIKVIIKEKNIHTFMYEAHYMYHELIADFNKQFDVDKIIAKTGLETYDDDFREKVLNKGFIDKLDLEYFHQTFDAVNLLIGIKGQTIEMIERDLQLASENLDIVLVNIFTENSQDVNIDEELIKQFYEIYPKYQRDNVIVYDHKNAVGLG
ncbi:hypothetical protein L0B53_12490 [Vibrio sp. SS-MA-C1-2]|uniref:hypothetical protein n=1 Tax=Vibrio sp. SS-MA-C1-2 TaxID=2908646 RepID=UPI001F232C2F|nr:hypothetical protein [Vibrio sp. SS-MA-C1-2]UJF17844.1 hypothetical protein L0B53_12490 [Vibrio sp. SS-MA-C1-2]